MKTNTIDKTNPQGRDRATAAAVRLLEQLGAAVVERCPSPRCSVCDRTLSAAA